MNGTEQRTHRSVTERLADRLDVIEPLVDRMMRNGDALYQGHEANAARISVAVQCCQDRWDLTKGALDDAARVASLQTQRLDYVTRHTMMPFWQRLRWLVMGH